MTNNHNKNNPDKITLVCHHSTKNSINCAFVDTSLVRRRVRTKHCQFKCTPQGNVVPGTFFDQQFYKTFVPHGVKVTFGHVKAAELAACGSAHAATKRWEPGKSMFWAADHTDLSPL